MDSAYFCPPPLVRALDLSISYCMLLSHIVHTPYRSAFPHPSFTSLSTAPSGSRYQLWRLDISFLFLPSFPSAIFLSFHQRIAWHMRLDTRVAALGVSAVRV